MQAIDFAMERYFYEIKKGVNNARFTLEAHLSSPLSQRNGLNILLRRLTECRSRGSKVIFIGNGGSAATAECGTRCN